MLKHFASFAFRNSSDVPKWFQQAMASQSQRRRPAQSIKLIVPNTWFLKCFYTSVIVSVTASVISSDSKDFIFQNDLYCSALGNRFIPIRKNTTFIVVHIIILTDIHC